MLSRYVMILLMLLGAWSTSIAQGRSALEVAIDNMVNKQDSNLNAGIIVESADTGKILYARNAERLYTPASNMKIITAYAALKLLGPDYHFKTSIYTDPVAPKQGVLHGNVYLEFDGDPSLSREGLNTLVGALKKANITRIDGRLIVVNDMFDPADYGPGWMWEEVNYCDGAPSSGLVVDHNCFRISITPSSINNNAIVKADSSAFRVNSRVMTVPPRTPCSVVIRADETNLYNVKGCVNGRAGNGSGPNSAAIDVAVKNVDLYVEKLALQALKNNQITLNGAVTTGNSVPHTNPILVLNSPPLSELLSDMLKFSDNLYANAMFKKLGQADGGNAGTWKSAERKLKRLMQAQFSISPKSWVAVDGSGLSRYNLITPKQILMVLNSVYRNPQLKQVLMTDLPIGGIDGTLRYRLHDAPVRGRVFAKTGSMKGVSSLSGYIKTKSGQNVVFVMLMNNFIGSARRYRALQDKICLYLASQNYA